MWQFHEDDAARGALNSSPLSIGESLDRPTSAPPALELSRDALFALSGQTGLLDIQDHIRYGIGDVRLIPNYEKFYEQRRDPSLPPPLERSPFASQSALFAESGTTPSASNPNGARPQNSMGQYPQANQLDPHGMNRSIQRPTTISRPTMGMSQQPSSQQYSPNMVPQMSPSLSAAQQQAQEQQQKYLAMVNSFGGMFVAPGTGAPGQVQQMMTSGFPFPQQYGPGAATAQNHYGRHQSMPNGVPASPNSANGSNSANGHSQLPHPHIQSQNRRGGMPVVSPQPSPVSPPQMQHHQNNNNARRSDNGEIWNQQQMPSVVPSAGNPPGSPSSAPVPIMKSSGAGLPRNKNIGKVAINSDSNLSSSTEDLLALAGKTHLRAFASGNSGSTGNLLAGRDSPSVGGESEFMGSQTLTELPQLYPAPQQSQQVPSLFDALHAQTHQSVVVAPNPAATLLPNHQPPTPAGAIVVPNALTGGQPTTPPRSIVTAGLPITNSAASSNPTTPTNAPSLSQVCRYYAQGYCSRGEKCTFLHTTDPVLLAEAEKAAAESAAAGKKSPRMISSPTRYLTMSLEECVGQIYPMCKDQHGCRFLQRKLDEDGDAAVKMIFDEVIEHIVDLMSDPFGNYLCQKLIEHSNNDQRLAIVRGVASHLVLISKNMHGTRAVQKTIEHLGSAEEIRLVRDALRGSVVGLIQDLNGNHVIQKCLHKMEPNDNQFIYDAVAQHCVQVASHRHGCCVMQRCIEHASEKQKMQLVNEIKNSALALVQDAFGNYVVQYVLDLGMESVCEAIATNLLGHLFYLSTQKFSSNVVEKCLKVGNPRTIQIISKELAEWHGNPNQPHTAAPPGEDLLIQLLQHPYGNYVVQTALQEALTKAPREWYSMANRIRPFLPALRSTPYAKRVQGLLSPPKMPVIPDTADGLPLKEDLPPQIVPTTMPPIIDPSNLPPRGGRHNNQQGHQQHQHQPGHQQHQQHQQQMQPRREHQQRRDGSGAPKPRGGRNPQQQQQSNGQQHQHVQSVHPQHQHQQYQQQHQQQQGGQHQQQNRPRQR